VGGNGNTAGSASEDELDERVFNTFFKNYFLIERHFLIISARTSRLDSPFRLSGNSIAGLLITLHEEPDKRSVKRQTQQP
jgi:hypothetical protein